MDPLTRRDFAAVAAGSALLIPFTVEEADGAPLDKPNTKWSFDKKVSMRVTGTLKKSIKGATVSVTIYRWKTASPVPHWVRAKHILSTRLSIRLKPKIYGNIPPGKYGMVVAGQNYHYDLKVAKRVKENGKRTWSEVASMVGSI